MRKRIEMTHYEDGTVKVEAFGFEGESCMNATKEIEALLGRVDSQTLKSEFYETNKATAYDATKLCG